MRTDRHRSEPRLRVRRRLIVATGIGLLVVAGVLIAALGDGVWSRTRTAGKAGSDENRVLPVRDERVTDATGRRGEATSGRSPEASDGVASSSRDASSSERHRRARELGLVAGSAASDATSPLAGLRLGDTLGAGATGVTLRIHLLDASSGRDLETSEATFSFRSSKRFFARRATTDADGVVRLRGLPPERYTLRTRASQYQVDLRRIDLAAAGDDLADDTARISIELEPGHAIAGTVVDASNAPIAGATLRWVRRSRSSLVPASGSATATSGSDGSFAIGGEPAGEGLLSVVHDGYRSPLPLELTLPRSAGVRLELKPDTPVELHVVDERATPIDGARIALRVVGELGGWRRALGLRESWTTGSKGRTSMAGLPAGDSQRLQLEVTRRGFQPQTIVTTVERLDRATRAGGFEIVLRAGGVVSGVVVDTQGAPAANVRLRLRGGAPGGKPLERRLATTADGTFRFEGLPEATLALEADGGDRGHAVVDDLDPQAPSSDSLRVRLEPASGEIAGEVRDPTGQPLGRVPVRAESDGRLFETLSGSRGDFRLSHLPEGDYRLRAGNTTHGHQSFASVPTGTRDLAIELGASGSLHGVIDQSGPPGPFTIRLEPRATATGTGPQPHRGPLSYRFTARDLRFECLRVPAGRYDVSLVRGGKTLDRVTDIEVVTDTRAGPLTLRDD